MLYFELVPVTHHSSCNVFGITHPYFPGKVLILQDLEAIETNTLLRLAIFPKEVSEKLSLPFSQFCL